MVNLEIDEKYTTLIYKCRRCMQTTREHRELGSDIKLINTHICNDKGIGVTDLIGMLSNGYIN